MRVSRVPTAGQGSAIHALPLPRALFAFLAVLVAD